MEKQKKISGTNDKILGKLYQSVCDAIFCVIMSEEELGIEKEETKRGLEEIRMELNKKMLLSNKKKATKTTEI